MYDLSLLVFLHEAYKYETEVCNGCHDMSMMAYELESIAILKLVDYRWVIQNMSGIDAINRLNSYVLNDNDSL